jgi:hypothetical protein
VKNNISYSAQNKTLKQNFKTKLPVASEIVAAMSEKEAATSEKLTATSEIEAASS